MCQIVIVEIDLTNAGLSKYEEVTAIFFAYLDKVKEWLTDAHQGKAEFVLFEEVKTMNDLGFTMYKVPDQTDNVCAITTQMVWSRFDSADLNLTQFDSEAAHYDYGFSQIDLELTQFDFESTQFDLQ